jgi:dTMP kinase
MTRTQRPVHQSRRHRRVRQIHAGAPPGRGHARLGRDPVLTREPGGAPGAEDIRRLLVEGDPARWSPETEILLFTAARRDHLERTIRPALAAGQDVITDRFADSTRVYQGATRGDLRGLVDTIHDAAIGVEPDLTLILDMDPAIALDRGLARSSGEDRFEEFGLPFQEKLRAGFLRWRRGPRPLRHDRRYRAIPTPSPRALPRSCARASSRPLAAPRPCVLHRGA